MTINFKYFFQWISDSRGKWLEEVPTIEMAVLPIYICLNNLNWTELNISFLYNTQEVGWGTCLYLSLHSKASAAHWLDGKKPSKYFHLFFQQHHHLHHHKAWCTHIPYHSNTWHMHTLSPACGQHPLSHLTVDQTKVFNVTEQFPNKLTDETDFPSQQYWYLNAWICKVQNHFIS